MYTLCTDTHIFHDFFHSGNTEEGNPQYLILLESATSILWIENRPYTFQTRLILSVLGVNST